MLISQVNSIKNSNYMRYNSLYASKINFRGVVDDEFFKAAKLGDKQKQLKCLKNIKFDINSLDAETGDNFLHVAIKSGNRQIINSAMILLANNKPELVNKVLNQSNNENKKPSDCTSDEAILSLMDETAKRIGVADKNTTTPAIPPEAYMTINDIVVKPIAFCNDDNTDVYEKYLQYLLNTNPKEDFKVRNAVPLNRLAEYTEARQILQECIVDPLNNGKNSIGNSFLLYGDYAHEKTGLLNSLSASLNKGIINKAEFKVLVKNAILNNIDNTKEQQKEISQILNSNVIEVDDIQQLYTVICLAKENYKNSGKQTVVFINEVRMLPFDENLSFSNNVGIFNHLIEKSATNGIVIVAATEFDNSIINNSIHFEREIELGKNNE